LARKDRRPVIAFGGRLEDSARPELRTHFDELLALSELEPALTQKQHMMQAPELLRRHAAHLAARIAAKT
jgi:hypothetical protein